MSKIVIVVEDGLVQDVFSSSKNIEVEILDMDTNDPDRFREKEAELAKLSKSTRMKSVY